MTSALKILSILLKPSSISGDAQTIHNTILSLTAKPLEAELRSLSSSPLGLKRSDITPLLAALAPFTSTSSTRTIYPSRSERSSWTSTPQGGLLSSLRQTLHALILWASTPSLSTSVASYTHRQFLYAVSLLGALPVLQAMLAELKLQFSSSNSEIALDVIVSFICAPNSIGSLFAAQSQSHQQHEKKLSLRSALHLELEETAPKLLSTDPLSVELIIRLSRRVEAFLSSSSLDMLHVVDPQHHDGNAGDHGIGDVRVDGSGGGIDPTDAAAGGIVGGVVDMQDVDVNVDVDGDAFAAALSAAGVGVGLDGGDEGGMGMDLS